MRIGVWIRRSWVAVLAIAGVLCVVSAVQAQPVPPVWDHYWVYAAHPSPAPPPPVVLHDQFGTWTHGMGMLRFFQNPARKEHEGLLFEITRPDLHYIWWEIEPIPFQRPGIAVENQFGHQIIDVFDARFLLTPARKNEPGLAPPLANHYKCYDCLGAPVQVPVLLMDQFQMRMAIVLVPRFLCNPVAKELPGGVVFPIEDPEQHYVVYELDPGMGQYTATLTDQFVMDWPVTLGPDLFLAVPSFKHDPTPATQDTWGRVKALYR